MTFEVEPEVVLERLRALRAGDAPTHGGRVLSYVYDPGIAGFDALVEEAARLSLHLNGLDPVVFGSIGAMERDVVGFVRDLLHGEASGGDDDVVGTVTSGGTESILLATLAAREARPGRSRVVVPSTRHSAWRKAAHLVGLELDVVPVGADGVVDGASFAARLDDDVALAVLSAPSYPFAALDPIEHLSHACLAADVDLHVDACIGGLALPFWPEVPAWDLRLPGVTSISADLHKYAYAPKGASVLLQRGRARRSSHYFADVEWPGYPVVTSTLLGSRQAAGLAGAWAAVTALGVGGLRTLMASCIRTTERLHATVDDIEGLRVVGSPVGPLLALATDEDSSAPVDPLRLVMELRAEGFLAQGQPALRQSALDPAGPDLSATAHLTITPALAPSVDELCAALERAAERSRGSAAPSALQAALHGLDLTGDVDAGAIVAALGEATGGDLAAVATEGTELFDLIATLPAGVVESLMAEVVARHLDPPPNV